MEWQTGSGAYIRFKCGDHFQEIRPMLLVDLMAVPGLVAENDFEAMIAGIGDCLQVHLAASIFGRTSRYDGNIHVFIWLQVSQGVLGVGLHSGQVRMSR